MNISSALAISLILAALLAGSGCLERGPQGDAEPPTGGSKGLGAYAPTMEVSGAVTNVVDGDTFDVEGFGRVRLAGVDCPEIDTPGGKAAKFFSETMLLGETVRLDVDGKNRYDRWVAVAYIEDPETGSWANFNSMLVTSGHAEVEEFQEG